MKNAVNIFWFRRDLRLDDNAGLYHALTAGLPVVPVFIFDKTILNQLEDKGDKRVAFIHATLCELQQHLENIGSTLHILYDQPIEAFKKLTTAYNIESVFTNHDYEPYAKERDDAIAAYLMQNGKGFYTFKDQVIFEKNEVIKDNNTPYTVFTPYSKKWKLTLTNASFEAYPNNTLLHNFLQQPPFTIPTLKEMGFHAQQTIYPKKELDEAIVKKYSQNRDFPGLENSTSKLGIHLRFGTVSIRQIASIAMQLNETFLNELIWRDFYQMILWHFPKVGMGKAFKAEYEKIPWRNDEEEFGKWCKGQTGYPIVDAGMRELNSTGFMHNRVRMITASFLTKHLLIDWRWGEAYFAQKLLDFDLASNNGGWQWAAGSGCDAAPYFRIFNPYLQTTRFDKDLVYIKKWIPELNEFSYPKPIVQHEFARKRTLETYAKVLRPKQD